MTYKKNVAEYQFALKALGYYDGEIDGLKGVKTVQAIKKFQKDNGLWKDGVVGKKTAPKIEKAFVRAYQEKLVYLGLYDGAIDGIAGRITKQAVCDLQRENGLEVDLIVGKNTVAMLDKLVEKKKKAILKKGDQLSEHFKRKEFECNCVEKGLNYCDGYPVDIDAQLIKNLELVREKFGKPIIITSGLRCQKYNDSLKGSIKHSKHVQGKVVDIYIAGVTSNSQGKKEVIAYWYTLKGVNYAYTNESNMKNAVHLDVK